jgi:hypothetical protein
MDKTALVEPYIEDGRRLIDALERAEFPISAALWYYFPESDDWRLVVASSLVDRLGPLQAYNQVQKVLATLPPDFSLSLKEISVVSPKRPLIQTLKGVVHVGPNEHGRRLRQSTIDGQFVEDAYIYRTT